jgi:phosphoglycolate phosphatase-like HAD superfamily hydrolase
VTIALFWDIDGTLLSTARAGVFSLEDALERVSGIHATLAELETAGFTDYAIAENALRSVGNPAEEETVRELLRIHGEQLGAYLGRREGQVMPEVRENLEQLAGREDVVNLLLTGNIESGAWAKLAHYDLDRFFAGGGAFCDGPGERVEIARRAAALCGEVEQTYVIGDTPHDIAAGDAIGARTIAVATGSYDVDELARHGAWRVFERLPEPARFIGVVGLESA